MRLLTSLLLAFTLDDGQRNHSLLNSGLVSIRSRRSMAATPDTSDNDNHQSSSPQRPQVPPLSPPRSIIHCDHAGASPSPSCVVETVWKHMKLEQEVGGYAAAEQRGERLRSVYGRIARQLLRSHHHRPPPHHHHDHNEQKPTGSVPPQPHPHEMPDPTHEIALVESATVAWTRLFYAMAQYQHERRRRRTNNDHNDDQHQQPLVILVSEAEYAANVVAACQWAKDHQHTSSSFPSWTVLSIPSTRRRRRSVATTTTTTAQEENNGGGFGGSSTGVVDLRVLQDMLEGKYHYQTSDTSSSSSTVVTLDPASIALICITHIPTNSGIVNDIEGIGRLIADYNTNNNQQDASTVNTVKNDDDDDGGDSGDSGSRMMPSILYLVDACQSIGQREIRVDRVHCHGLVAAGRKFLRGPRGTGFLYVPATIANHLIPHHVDHFGVPVTAVPSSEANSHRRQDEGQDHQPNDNDGDENHRHHLAVPVESTIRVRPKAGASRFEFYESNIANKLGLGEAIRHATEEVGIPKIQSTCLDLALALYGRLKEMDKVRVHHGVPQCGIVTFFVPGVPSKRIKDRLWDDHDVDVGDSRQPIKFSTSLVPATSTPLDSSQTQVPDMVRVSLSYTNTAEDVEALCTKLSSIVAELRAEFHS